MMRELLADREGGVRPIDNYEIIKPIGKGKFAIVYRAKRLADGTVVALKKILTENMDAKARNKCLKEVRLLQSLHHPNIVAYLDSFIEGNELIIVFEWAESGDLKRQVRKAQERQVRFEERVIWKYFAQICEAIRHMHDRRIMHRDLKPANIFLTLNGTVKVGDLGLGREMSEHTVEAHSKVGTPLYMSPEVLRGDGYDFRSDIWSVGCLLYELAMLKSPFKAEGLNLYSLFQKISKADYQPLPDHYSEELRELAYSMLNIDPAARPNIHDVCERANAMRQRTSQAAAQARMRQQQLQQQQMQPVEAAVVAQPVQGGSGGGGGGGGGSEEKFSGVRMEEAAAAQQHQHQQQQQHRGRGGGIDEGKFADEGNYYGGGGGGGGGGGLGAPMFPQSSDRPRTKDSGGHRQRSAVEESPPQQQQPHISRTVRGTPEQQQRGAGVGGVHTMALSPPDATNHNTQIPPMQMQMQMQMQQSKAGGGGGGGGKGLSGKQINHVVLSAMEELWHMLELTGYCDHRRGLAVPGGLGSGGGGGGGPCATR